MNDVSKLLIAYDGSFSSAEKWDADSIFVGTKDVHGLRHVLHGSVSSAVAARAHCSVEVARAVRGRSK